MLLLNGLERDLLPILSADIPTRRSVVVGIYLAILSRTGVEVLVSSVSVAHRRKRTRSLIIERAGLVRDAGQLSFAAFPEQAELPGNGRASLSVTRTSTGSVESIDGSDDIS